MPGADVVRRMPMQARAPTAKPGRSKLGKRLTVALASLIAAVALSAQPSAAADASAVAPYVARRSEAGITAPALLSPVAPVNVALAAAPASAQHGATPVVQMLPPRVAAWDVFGRLQRLEDTIFTKEDAKEMAREMEARADKKSEEMEKKSEDMEARMDRQFYVTTAISIVVPFVMLNAPRSETFT